MSTSPFASHTRAHSLGKSKSARNNKPKVCVEPNKTLDEYLDPPRGVSKSSAEKAPYTPYTPYNGTCLEAKTSTSLGIQVPCQKGDWRHCYVGLEGPSTFWEGTWIPRACMYRCTHHFPREQLGGLDSQRAPLRPRASGCAFVSRVAHVTRTPLLGGLLRLEGFPNLGWFAISHSGR